MGRSSALYCGAGTGLHFTVNTFTDKEWGYGDEEESVFQPTDFSAKQIVQTAKAAGMTNEEYHRMKAKSEKPIQLCWKDSRS